MMPDWLLALTCVGIVLLFIVAPVSVEMWAERQERKDKDNEDNKRNK